MRPKLSTIATVSVLCATAATAGAQSSAEKWEKFGEIFRNQMQDQIRQQQEKEQREEIEKRTDAIKRQQDQERQEQEQERKQARDEADARQTGQLGDQLTAMYQTAVKQAQEKNQKNEPQAPWLKKQNDFLNELESGSKSDGNTRKSDATAPELASNPEEVFRAAHNAYQQGNIDLAKEGYETGLRMRLDPYAVYYLASLYERTGAVDDADRLLKLYAQKTGKLPDLFKPLELRMQARAELRNTRPILEKYLSGNELGLLSQPLKAATTSPEYYTPSVPGPISKDSGLTYDGSAKRESDFVADRNGVAVFRSVTTQVKASENSNYKPGQQTSRSNSIYLLGGLLDLGYFSYDAKGKLDTYTISDDIYANTSPAYMRPGDSLVVFHTSKQMNAMMNGTEPGVPSLLECEASEWVNASGIDSHYQGEALHLSCRNSTVSTGPTKGIAKSSADYYYVASRGITIQRPQAPG